MKLAHFTIFPILLTTLIGCSSMKPGQMAWVTPESTAPRAGNVYLLRGWIGVFSTGIDNLTRKLNDSGIRANVYQDDQWRSLANSIREKYRGKSAEPLILVGHSYGADDVVRISRELSKDNIKVDLLMTLDPVTPPNVPANVAKCVNLYQSNGITDSMPWLRGIPLEKEKNATATVLVNANLRKDRPDLLEAGTDHFNIEKKERIHEEIIRQVLTVCPPRQTWAASHRGSTSVGAKPIVKATGEPVKSGSANEDIAPMGGS